MVPEAIGKLTCVALWTPCRWIKLCHRPQWAWLGLQDLMCGVVEGDADTRGEVSAQAAVCVTDVTGCDEWDASFGIGPSGLENHLAPVLCHQFGAGHGRHF